MRSKTRNPGSALQRATGANVEIQTHPNFHTQIYASCSELQRRHVMQRCGVIPRQASLIAGLLFGEGYK